MKSIVMAVLLIAAVGAGVYFLFLNKKKAGIVSTPVRKELIIGKWKLDSLSHTDSSTNLFPALAPMIDSNFANYAYQFQQDGKVVRLLNDSIQKDSSSYQWEGDQLVLKQQTDSAGTNFIVSLLSGDSLVLQSKDSTVAYFTKVKR